MMPHPRPGSASTPTAISPDEALDLVAPGYAPLHGVWDEMLDELGKPRPAWQQFLTEFSTIDARDLARRRDLARAASSESDPLAERSHEELAEAAPHTLEPFPFLIGQGEWQVIEAGIIQRIELFDRLYDDLYGPQTLLSRGVIPPGVIFGHPGYLRPLCQPAGTKKPKQHHVLAAFDLVRDAHGAWRILADRGQAPAGPGYLLINRIAMSRMLPEIFRELHVNRLARAFQHLRSGLIAQATRNNSNPRIVMLAADNSHPTHYEHVYLARYMGYQLVDGGDLTVRDRQVFLKTLGGLEPVDVIFRRIRDARADPLEIQSDSGTGVAGLVQAVRLGTVNVVNSLGSGLLENPALRAVLPEVARQLLGQELKLNSVDTWWCGDPEVLGRLLDAPQQYVIEHITRSNGQRAMSGARMGSQELRRVLARVEWRPGDYAISQRVIPSTTPAWMGDMLVPRHMVLRVFVVGTPEGYELIPGGLVRVSQDPEDLLGGSRGAPSTKDAWVLSPTPVEHFSLLHLASQPVRIRRGGLETPSRMAENFFWLGRYVERLEGQARLLRSILSRLEGEGGADNIEELSTFAHALGFSTSTATIPQPLGDDDESFMDSFTRHLLHELMGGEHAMGLRQTLRLIHGSARAVRDRLSADTWRLLTSLERDYPQSHHEVFSSTGESLELLDRMVLTIAAFSGLMWENVVRGRIWGFLDVGRRLERALGLVDLLRCTIVQRAPSEERLLQALLEVADSAMTYRSRYLNSIQAAPVLDLLLMDESNPRSLAFQMLALEREINDLPRDTSSGSHAPEQKRIMRMITSLRWFEVEELAKADSTGMRSDLASLFGGFIDELPELSNDLSRSYFSHVEARWQMARKGRKNHR